MSSPAEKVIAAFRGVRAVARAVNRNPSTVSRWPKPRDQGGLGGCVPTGLQGVILEKAREAGLSLTAEDLISYADKTDVSA